MSFFKRCLIVVISAPLVLLGGCYQPSMTKEIVDETPEDSFPKKNDQSADESSESELIENQTYQLISVGDGDTIRIKGKEGKITVRLACLDAAELKQSPYGKQAQKRLQTILPIDTVVRLKRYTIDRYDRWVAEIFKEDININLALVSEGQAVAYRKYLDQCDSEQYLTAEATAKSKGLAFWSQKNPIMPWDYRRGVRPEQVARTSEPSLQDDASTCDRSYPDICIPPAPPDLDCRDISHRRFRVDGPDPHQFDRNRDGVGCEGK